MGAGTDSFVSFLGSPLSSPQIQQEVVAQGGWGRWSGGGGGLHVRYVKAVTSLTLPLTESSLSALDSISPSAQWGA